MTHIVAAGSEVSDLDTARSRAASYDADDAPLGHPVGPIRLPDHAALAAEDTTGIDFTELLAAEFHPERPQDRIEHPWLSPAALDEAAEALIATLPLPIGRHNRYRPVPGEDALRTDDLLDFVRWYGHEYQILVFRAADVRTASLLDLEKLTAAGRAEGASIIWDWTGAFDWAPIAPQEGVAAVFWSAHRSLIDGRRVEAGVWHPTDGDFPAHLMPRPLVASVRARTSRLAEFAARASAAAFGDAASVRAADPHGSATGIPVLVLDAPAAAAIADALAAGPGFRTVVRYGERVVALPDAGATYTAIGERLFIAAEAGGS